MLGDTKDHTFHDAATAAGLGTYFDNHEGFNTLSVDIDGDPDSFTLNFEHMGINKVKRAIKGMNSADWTSATTTSTSHQTWEFTIAGKKRVYMNLASITPGSGNLTVKGTAGY